MREREEIGHDATEQPAAGGVQATASRPHATELPGAGRGAVPAPGAQEDLHLVFSYYNENRAKLRNYAIRFIRDADLAEDLVQQAMVNTIEAVRHGAEVVSVPAWLHRCVHNLAMNELRRNPTESLSDDAVAEEAAVAPQQSTAAELAEARELWRAVEGAIHELPDHFREALLMAEVQGLSYKEIAGELDRSVHSVNQILRRARIQLRAAIGDRRLPLAAPLPLLPWLRHVASGIKQLQTSAGQRIYEAHASVTAALARALDPFVAPLASLLVAAATFTAIGAAEQKALTASGGELPAATALYDPTADVGPRSRSPHGRNRADARHGSPDPGAAGVRDDRSAGESRDERRATHRAVGSAAGSDSSAQLPPPDPEAPAQANGYLTTGVDGAVPDGSSGEPALSTGGETVAYSSSAANLVQGDSNGVSDVFATDWQGQATAVVSVAPSGAPANGPSHAPAVSADARHVAFESQASNLSENDANATTDVFVKDRETGGVDLASASAAGEAANGPSSGAALSADGRYVAFQSYASDLIAPPSGSPAEDGLAQRRQWSGADVNGAEDVFVRDLQTGAIELASRTQHGGAAAGASRDPAISADGRCIAFVSSASDLVAGDLNGEPDIFVYDARQRTVKLVSRTTSGEPANGASRDPEISANGRYVAFTSEASNLAGPNDGGRSDVFVHDRLTGQTTIASSAVPPGAPPQRALGPAEQAAVAVADPSAESAKPSLSADGRFVAFETVSSGGGGSSAGSPPHETKLVLRDLATGRTWLGREDSLAKRLGWTASAPTLDPAAAVLAGVTDARLHEGTEEVERSLVFVRTLDAQPGA